MANIPGQFVRVAIGTVLLAILSVTSAPAPDTDLLLIEKNILDTLFNGYDSRIRPNGRQDNGPVVVTVDAYVRSIDNPDFDKDIVSLQITLRQTWNDSRLAFSSITAKLPYVTIKPATSIWTPDTFFANAQSSFEHNVLAPNVLLRVTPDGVVFYSKRVTVNIRLNGNLRSYPFDSQDINMRLASYGYTTSDLVYQWKSVFRGPVQMSKSSSNTMDYIFVGPVTTATDCKSTTPTGEYSCLRAIITLERKSGSIVLKAFLPSVLMVLLGYLSFFVDHKATTARLLYILVVLVFMFTNINVFNLSSPTTTCCRAVDIWTGTSLTFVTGALVEFVLLSYLLRHKAQGSGSEPLLSDVEKAATTDGGNGGVQPLVLEKEVEVQNVLCDRLVVLVGNPVRLDQGARWLYPSLYGFFALVFTIFYSF